MARPKKQEVDYFPHYCDHGKVLFILENHFKNDGYAVLYKIEELLAKTEGHCYNCSSMENWEYLLSKMGTTEEIVLAIIEKLSTMNIIDTDLWKEKRLWMQSFVDSISDVYARRKVELPIKPELLHTKTPLNGITDDGNPQSKVKESKVKESKVKNTPAKAFILPQWISQETWDAYLELRKKKRAANTDYALTLIIRELEKLAGGNISLKLEILNKSIKNGWTDVYPIDKGGNNGNKQTYGNRRPEPELSDEANAAIAKVRQLSATVGSTIHSKKDA